MATSSLTVRKRDRIGKTGAAKVRKDKLIPAVIYGRGTESAPLEVSPGALKEAISGGSGRNTLLEISIENSAETVLSILKDVQTDPLTGHPRHLDFQIIDPDTPIRVEVPIEFVGQSQGIKDGGILEAVERNFRIKCLPTQIPDRIEVSIAELEIGDSLHVRDISFADGLEILNSPDDTVVMVIAPRAAISEAQTQAREEGEEAEQTEEAETKETEDTPAEDAADR